MALLVCANVALAVTNSAAGARLGLLAHLMLGPIEGWIGAAQFHSYPSALWVLVPITLTAAVPLVLHAITGARAWLACATFFWFFGGYYFCIGVGV